MFDKGKKKHSSHREEEQAAGQHVTNAAGDVTPEQTSEQQQQGNSNLDNQKAINLDASTNPPKQEEAGVPPTDSPTSADMKGTVTDPVSFSNPAYDPSIDAAKVDASGAAAEQDSSDILHVFKPGHFYKKGDTVRYHGIMFKALQDGHGDIAPSMWAPTGEEAPETTVPPQADKSA